MKMEGSNKQERVTVNQQQPVVEVVAQLLGTTYEYTIQQFNISYKGKTLNLSATIEEVGIREQEFIVIHPKLKGGAGGEQELVIAQTKIKEQKE